MRSPTAGFLVAWTAVGLGSCSGPPPEIDGARVARVLTVLSADDMLGRRPRTTGAERAAEFLAQEFATAGLEPFAGLPGYRQEFPVYSVTVDSYRVVLDGSPAATEDVALSVSGPIAWHSDPDVAVVSVSRDDNPMQALRPAFQGRGNTLVLLDRAHEQLIERFRRFMSGSAQVLQPGVGANTIFVLADDLDVESFQVDVAVATEESGRMANVLGVIPGRRSEEIVVFSAHYDHIGIVQPVDGDSIANGANDDASGTAAVVELARYFTALGRPQRTLLFVAFTAEESGGYGSRYLASQLDPSHIVAMLNIEMIGKVAAEGSDRAWVTGFDRSNLGSILDDAVNDSLFAFYADPYEERGLFFASDNATFARLGVPAHSISTTPIDVDEDYHRVTDEIETLDLQHVTSVVRGIAEGALPLVMGTATPTRIDTSTLR